MQTTSLNKWFFRNTRLPLFALAVVVALVQVCFSYYTHNKSKNEQISAIESLVATVANIGIEQGNRPLLESSFQLAIQELGVNSILVCEKERKLFHQPMGFGSCPVPPKVTSMQSMIQVTPSGFKDFKLYFYVDKFHFTTPFIILNLVIFLMLGIVLAIIHNIQTRLTKDILEPLERDLSGEDDLKISELNVIREKFKDYLESIEKRAAAGAILEQNMSISHNIQSIRQTLEVLRSGAFTSDSQRSRFEQISDQIKAIMVKIAEQTPDKNTAELIVSDETFYKHMEKENEKKTKVNVFNLFETAIELKKIELQKSKNQPKINFIHEPGINKKFIEAVGPELRDVLSNLMNNSIQAGANNIDIEVKLENENLVCLLRDDGCSIEAEIRKTIFERGFTKGKEDGTGYGLYHAKKFIESWGGDISLSEAEEASTEFVITLPLWQTPQMRLEHTGGVVVLDDEDSIHQMWRNKVSRLNPSATVRSFKTYADLYNWFESCDDAHRYIFLIDSDFGDENMPGEKVIDELGINESAFLVTNHYNKPALVQWCDERAIGVVPKAAVC